MVVGSDEWGEGWGMMDGGEMGNDGGGREEGWGMMEEGEGRDGE